MLRSFTGSAQGVHEACMRGARRANAARAAVRDGTEGVGDLKVVQNRHDTQVKMTF